VVRARAIQCDMDLGSLRRLGEPYTADDDGPGKLHAAGAAGGLDTAYRFFSLLPRGWDFPAHTAKQLRAPGSEQSGESRRRQSARRQRGGMERDHGVL